MTKSKLDFPDGPYVGQEHAHSGVQWQWNGSGWVRQYSGAGGTSFSEDDTTRIAKDIDEMIGIHPVKKGDVTVVANKDTYKNLNGSNGALTSWKLISNIGSGSGSSTFIALTDTPVDYLGKANNLLKINAAENAVEFTDIIKGGTF